MKECCLNLRFLIKDIFFGFQGGVGRGCFFRPSYFFFCLTKVFFQQLKIDKEQAFIFCKHKTFYTIAIWPYTHIGLQFHQVSIYK